MKPATRTGLSLVPLILQFVATATSLGVSSFFLPPLTEFLKAHEGKFVVPAPTLVLIEYPGTVRLAFIGLFALSAFSVFVTRLKVKDEADRLAIQGAVFGITWYFGIVFMGGVLMAAALPYFALHQP